MALTMKRLLFTIAPAILVGLSAPAAAQDADVPYWASISVEEVNMRVGPGTKYPVEWVYRREGLPLKVVRLMQGWRLVQDPDGDQGWIVGIMLTRERTAIVTGKGVTPMLDEPGKGDLRWNVEPGVIGKLGDCRENYCLLDVEGHVGWVAADRLWGEGEP